MAITPTTSTQSLPSASGQRTQDPGSARDTSRSTDPGNRSFRQQTSVQSLEFSLEVSIQSADQSQTLLYRATYTNISESISTYIGPEAPAAPRPLQDFSPEAVSGRLLDFATGLFDAFASRRPDDALDQVLEDFAKLIRDGFEQGFNEARDILEGLGVFNGSIQADAERTFELFVEGLDAFLSERLGNTGEADPATA